MAPELVFDERRRMLHNTCGREIWLEQFRVLYDVPASRFTTKLLGDITFRFPHSRWCERGCLWQLSLQGTRQGGRFEITFVGVTELDEQGLFFRHDIHDLDRLEDARARFAELTPASRRRSVSPTRQPRPWVR